MSVFVAGVVKKLQLSRNNDKHFKPWCIQCPLVTHSLVIAALSFITGFSFVTITCGFAILFGGFSCYFLPSKLDQSEHWFSFRENSFYKNSMNIGACGPPHPCSLLCAFGNLLWAQGFTQTIWKLGTCQMYRTSNSTNVQSIRQYRQSKQLKHELLIGCVQKWMQAECALPAATRGCRLRGTLWWAEYWHLQYIIGLYIKMMSALKFNPLKDFATQWLAHFWCLTHSFFPSQPIYIAAKRQAPKYVLFPGLVWHILLSPSVWNGDQSATKFMWIWVQCTVTAARWASG